MSKYLSRKIKFLSLFSIFAVVFVHAYNYKDSFLTPVTLISEKTNLYAMFEYFISNGLGRFAVPMFFIFSGFLFFRNYKSIKESYFVKLKSRFFSIIIPYICWAIVSGLFMLLLNYFNSFRNLEVFKDHSVKSFGELIFSLINPPAFQLWFLQQLIIYTLISPIIYLLIKKTKGFVLILSGLLWLFDIHFIINSQGLFFFSVGAAIAIFNKDSFFTQKDNKKLTLFLVCLWVALSSLITYFASTNTAPLLIRLFLFRTNEVLGVISMWYLFDHIFKRIIDKKSLIRASNNVFFIYVLHEPLMHVCYQYALAKGTNDDLTHIILFVFLPICIIFFCIFASAMIRKISKPLHNVLTGGRIYGGKIHHK